ncbi:hypothetical protein [Enterococcus sp. AZ126]|uniref:hypothetical protein n=1 Tax=Enterococcus sp. AZ126 TaxID=2774635 RepID=UPI003F26D93D
MEDNLSRVNIYMVDDCDLVVAVSKEQAMQWSKKEYGDEECGVTAFEIDGTKKYVAEQDSDVSDQEKLDYLRLNFGRTHENHEPLKVGEKEVMITRTFEFYYRYTLQQELRNRFKGKTLVEVPFLLASTEY